MATASPEPAMAAAAPTPPRDRLIAEGSSARLFASRDAGGRSAALKLSRDPASDAALLIEADAAARFTHPALLPVLEQGRDEHGRVWLLMPLLSGRTLADWQAAVPDLLDALGPIADALDLLHHDGAGHADLKPANILLSEADGRTELKLGDLGLISALGEPAAGGTPAYLSPSRLDGKPFTWRDDLHAFAVLLYENLAGRLPWSAAGGNALLGEIRAGRVQSLRSFRAELPGELDGFFSSTLRGEAVAGSMMGWLDALRAHLGLRALPRRLFLRKSSGSGDDVSTRLRLTAWLTAHLYSSTSDTISPGQEELRSLEELAQGDVGRLIEIVAILVEQHWLQDRSGQAVFASGVEDIGERLRMRMEASGLPDLSALPKWGVFLAMIPISLSLEEMVEVLPIHGVEPGILLADLQDRGLVREDGPGEYIGAGTAELGELPGLLPEMPWELFAAMWQKGEARPGNRLRLLGIAVASGAQRHLQAVEQSDLIDLADRAPAGACKALQAFLRTQELDLEAACLLGLLDITLHVRSNALQEAVERYWSIDESLSVGANATLNRLLVYQLTDSGRVHEAQAFLKRWRERHSAQVAGTPIEIQIAARELNVLGTYGAQGEALELARDYQQRYSGRSGAWVLQMALANLAHDRGDGREAIIHAESALEGLLAERGSERMELDLTSYLAGAILHASDRVRWDRLARLLERAEELAARCEVLSISHRIAAIRGQRLRYRGDSRESTDCLIRVQREAARSGELRRAPFIERGLFIAARDRGEYQKLLLDLPGVEAIVQETEGIREILSYREDIVQLRLAVGDLAAGAQEVEALLAAARELGSPLYIGLFRGLRGACLVLRGEAHGSLDDLRDSIAHLEAAHALRDRNQYQLELIAVDPAADPDGALIAAVIDHEDAVGERRLLPRAWQLEARRLRRAGAIHDAALALEEAFRIAGTLVSPEHRWPLHVEAAELALAAGERGAARAELERAVEILHDLSLQFIEAAVRERFLARPDRRAVLTRLRALDA